MVPQIVLCAMLSGELPWMKAIMKDENFDKWVKNEHNYSPWTNVSIEVISLCRRILNPNPLERISMKDLLESKWLTNEALIGLKYDRNFEPFKT